MAVNYWRCWAGLANGKMVSSVFHKRHEACLRRITNNHLTYSGCAATGSQGTVLAHNDSERFESRFVSVAIEEGTPAIMLQSMHGSNFGGEMIEITITSATLHFSVR